MKAGKSVGRFCFTVESYFVYLQSKLLTMRGCGNTNLKTDEERYGYALCGNIPRLKENTL